MARKLVKLSDEEQKMYLKAGVSMLADNFDIMEAIKAKPGFYNEEGDFEEHHEFVMFFDFNEVKVCPTYGEEMVRLSPIKWDGEKPVLKFDDNGEMYNGDWKSFNEKNLIGIPKAVTPFNV